MQTARPSADGGGLGRAGMRIFKPLLLWAERGSESDEDASDLDSDGSLRSVRSLSHPGMVEGSSSSLEATGEGPVLGSGILGGAVSLSCPAP